MTGHAPTWRITGPTFDAAWQFAQKALDHPIVTDREDRTRWWTRVTITVTTDPALAETAPPMEELRKPPPIPEQVRRERPVALWNDEEYAESFSPLEEIFVHQEEVRAARRSVPRQRNRRSQGSDA
jgi:hypothetical protein